jgi:hypothetical protein
LLCAVVLVILGLIAAPGLFANRAIERAIENTCTNALTTPVTVDATRLSLLSGSLDLDGLTIANPAGYRHKTFLVLKRGDTHVKTLSLLAERITIHDLTFDGLELIVESNGSGSNLQDMIDALHKVPPLGRSFYVRNVDILNVTVRMAMPTGVDPNHTISLKLSPIRMTDLGRDERMDMAGLADEVTNQGMKAVSPFTGAIDKALDLGKTLLGAPDPNQPPNR